MIESNNRLNLDFFPLLGWECYKCSQICIQTNKVTILFQLFYSTILCQWDWKMWKKQNINRVHFSSFLNFKEIFLNFPTIYKLPELLFKFLPFSKYPKFSKSVDIPCLRKNYRKIFLSFHSSHFDFFPITLKFSINFLSKIFLKRFYRFLNAGLWDWLNARIN